MNKFTKFNHLIKTEDSYGNKYKSLQLNDGIFQSSLTENDRKLLKEYIIHAKQYDFVPKIDEINLGGIHHKHVSTCTCTFDMIDWITDILIGEPLSNICTLEHDIFLDNAALADDHIKMFVEKINQASVIYANKRQILVKAWCDINIDGLIELVCRYLNVSKMSIAPKLHVLRLGVNPKISVSGCKMLFNVMQNNFHSLKMIVLNPGMDDKCCIVIAEFFLKNPEHQLDQIWLTENENITEKGVMVINDMIVTNIEKHKWPLETDLFSKYEHKTFFMKFCGLDTDQIQTKNNVKLDFRIDL